MNTVKVPPKKSLGQNFLSNPRIISRIIEEANLNDTDTVLEVGPGRGDMTKKLAEFSGKVIAVEKDHRLIEELENKFYQNKNVRIIEDDILEFEPANHGLKDNDYKIVANLPYYITSHFLRTVLESWPRPKKLVLMVQKEVAKRMTAKPPDMNLLALSVQLYGQVAKMIDVSKNNFHPRPKVDSAVIAIVPYLNADQKNINETMETARAGFAHKRKKLLTNLAEGLGLDKKKVADVFTSIGLDDNIRAENLDLNQWRQLSDLIQ